MRKSTMILFSAVIGSVAYARPAVAETVIPPGQFTIDGISVSCRMMPTVITENINDTAMNNGQAILLNANAFFSLPTFLKLWIYAHECGHSVFGPNEDAADCFATKLGRNQGWFPPPAFQQLVAFFANNPGNWTHRPGQQRLQNIAACYQSY